MNRCANVNRAALIAFCSLSATTPVRAGPPQDDQFHTGQLQDDQLQPKHKKLVVHRVEPAVQLRHTMRDEINHGLLGIVAEGTDYTVDLALTLTSEQTHLRPLPIAGAGALQKCQGCHVRSRDRFCSCRPTCSMKSSATRLFQASKNTFDTSRSFMIKSFMSWPGQTSSRSMI